MAIRLTPAVQVEIDNKHNIDLFLTSKTFIKLTQCQLKTLCKEFRFHYSAGMFFKHYKLERR